MLKKGAIGPMDAAGLFLILVLIAALSPLIVDFVDGISNIAQPPASYMITLFPLMLGLAVISTAWRYGME